MCRLLSRQKGKTMSELIKREDAINAVAELQGIAQSKAELTGISKAWKRIKALPTVDAVPVVRCKDCRWACLAPQRQTATCMKKRLPSTHEYDYFCADGERKEKEND